MRQENHLAAIAAMSELGFTELEAAVYTYLVENSPATPYRVAREIGKPVANTYKVVQSLFQKGLVLIDETKNRQCEAIPPNEVLTSLKNSYLDRHKFAEDALSTLKPAAASYEKIYSLATVEQVFDRCQKLIDNAETVVLVDAYPGVIESIRPWLEGAAERGVTVVLEAYEPVKLKGVEIVPFQHADTMLRRWRGDWLIVVVDGAEYVFAFLGSDGRTVQNAIWCNSAFLALPQHSNLAHSFRASILEDLIRRNASMRKIKQELKRTEAWMVLGRRGYDKLAAEFTHE